MKSKQPKRERAAARGGRPQATRNEPQGDAYQLDHKRTAATVCPDCGAIYADGRWQWAEVPDPVGDARAVCPACQRIRDGYPAGEVRISGDFAREHREEIVARIHHVEKREKAERPLQRLMAAEPDGDALVVTTTDVHLANAIGRALHDAFKGELETPWAEKGDLLRISWKR